MPNRPAFLNPTERILVYSRGRWDLGRPGEQGDFGLARHMDYFHGVWRIAPERPSRVGHPAPFPEELVERLVRALSFPGAIVYDPFVGSGTSVAVAYRLRRVAWGSDIDPPCRRARRRDRAPGRSRDWRARNGNNTRG